MISPHQLTAEVYVCKPDRMRLDFALRVSLLSKELLNVENEADGGY